MKSAIIYITALFSLASLCANAQDYTAMINTESHHVEVARQSLNRPVAFPGGRAALTGYIAEHFTYPETALENRIEGTIVIRFIINEGGAVEHPVIVRPVHPCVDNVAIEVVQNMPTWVPAIVNGLRVRRSVVLPFKLSLDHI